MSLVLLPLIAGALAPQVRVVQSAGTTSLSFGAAAPFHTTSAEVTDARCIVAGDTYVATWREGGASRYAVSLDRRTSARTSSSSGILRLRYKEFDPLREQPAVPEGLGEGVDARTVIVQFVSQPLDEYRAALASLGATVQQYLPDDAYVVEVPEGRLDDVRALPFVRWAGAFPAAFRMEQALVDELASGRYAGTRLYVQVASDSRALKQRVATAAQLAGVQVLDCPMDGTLMEVYADADALRRLAKTDGVLWVEKRTEPSSDMDNVRVVSGANGVQTVGGFDGSGVKAHIIDAGFLRTHVDYSSRLTVRGNPGVDSHGTATTGIVGGNGSGNAAGKGMMPNCNLVVSAYQTNWSAAGRLSHTQDTVNVYNCVVESNSWGDSLTNLYTSISSYMDEIVYKTDLVILNSMSNWGNNTQVRPQAWAKNVVAIGGVNHFNDTNMTNDRWNNSASIGPAQDLRTKPELAFYYDSIFCPTSSSNTAYTSSFGGTSAATPMTAGAFGLFFDMWNDGTFGNSTLGATVFANRCHSTTARAFMVNSARMYQSQGDIDRNVQGWGVADLQNLWDKRDSVFWVDETDVLLNLQERTYRVWVPAGTANFRATMAYNDYWAAANANPTRVNNVSLKVVSPSGTTYWGNNGMTGSSGANVTAAGGSADTRNNLQNVYLANPASGVYVVTVKAENLAQDGRPETIGTVDADYALVVSGVASSVSPSAMKPYAKTLLGGTVATLAKSENNKLSLQRPLGPTATGTNQVGVEVQGSLPFSTVSKLDLLIEPESTATGTTVTVQFYDYSAGQWATVASHAVSTAKTAVVSVPGGSLSRFVEPGTNAVKARAIFQASLSPSASATWVARLDHVRWQAAP